MNAVIIGIPPTTKFYYSLAPYCLSAFVRANNPSWDVIVYQGSMNEETPICNIVDTILSHRPNIVGFSVYIWNFKITSEITLLLKQKSINTMVVWGGPEIAADYIRNGKLDNEMIDIAICGEGEITFNELLNNIVKGVPNINEIKGLAYRDKNTNKLVFNGERYNKTKVEINPSPYLNGIIGKEILEDKHGCLETQRGCNFRCAYCIYHKDIPKIIYSDAAQVIKEAEYMYNNGISALRILDANFASNPEFAKKIMGGIIGKGLRCPVFLEIIPGFIDEELAKLFSRYNDLSGKSSITVGMGVQTINYQSLKIIRRAIKIEKIEETIDLLKRYNIKTKIDIIIGLPGENLKSIGDTLSYFLDKLRESNYHVLCCHVLRNLPGTELFSIAEQFKMEFSTAKDEDPHVFIESPDLPRKDMVKALRRTAFVFRLVNYPGWWKLTRRRVALSYKIFSISLTELHWIINYYLANIIYHIFVKIGIWKISFVYRGLFAGHSIRNAFFKARERLSVTNIEIIDLLIEKYMELMKNRNSPFLNDDFPNAENWWTNRSEKEIPAPWLCKTLNSLNKDDLFKLRIK